MTTTETITADATRADGEHTRLQVTRDAGTVVFYLDGQEVFGLDLENAIRLFARAFQLWFRLDMLK